MNTTTVPTANTISRALNRDFGIRAVPRSRVGYHVSNGIVSVACSDLIGSRGDRIRAEELHAAMADLGYQVRIDDTDPILFIDSIPTRRG
jgi:hypothetical protein